VFDLGKMLHQLPAARWPQARRKSQRQPVKSVRSSRGCCGHGSQESFSLQLWRTVHAAPKHCQGEARISPVRMSGDSMAPLRVSAISFLNTAPLMWDFEQGDRARELTQCFELSYTVPSRCAEQLKAGSADIGIIPVGAYTTVPDLVVVPGVSIAAKSAVRSILLVSKVPAEKIRNVATDDSSRTSSALVEVFLRKFVGTAPGFTRQPPNLEEMLRWHDAALLIGDPALQANTDGYHVYDLAEQWQRWTGRP